MQELHSYLIQSPETAYEDGKFYISQRTTSCEWYYYDRYLENIKDFASRDAYRMEHDIFNAEFMDTVFYPRERLRAYLRYGKSLSGNVFEGNPNTKDNCDFNADLLIEF